MPQRPKSSSSTVKAFIHQQKQPMFLLVDEEFTVLLLDLGLCVNIVWHFVEPWRGVQQRNLLITFLTLAVVCAAAKPVDHISDTCYCLCSSKTCWSHFWHLLLSVQHRIVMNQKAQVCEECKSDYASTLQNFNTTQQEHFYTTMPQVFQVRATTMPQAFQVHATTMPQAFQVHASPPKNIGDGCSSQQFWRWICSPLEPSGGEGGAWFAVSWTVTLFPDDSWNERQHLDGNWFL